MKANDRKDALFWFVFFFFFLFFNLPKEILIGMKM